MVYIIQPCVYDGGKRVPFRIRLGILHLKFNLIISPLRFGFLCFGVNTRNFPYRWHVWFTSFIEDFTPPTQGDKWNTTCSKYLPPSLHFIGMQKRLALNPHWAKKSIFFTSRHVGLNCAIFTILNFQEQTWCLKYHRCMIKSTKYIDIYTIAVLSGA